MTLLGHTDRPVSRGMHKGRAVVIKRYLVADGAAVWADHRALWASPFGAARTVPGLPQPLDWDDATRALTMEALSGPALAVRGSLAGVAAATDDVAALAADLHASGAVVGRERAARHVVRSLRRKHAELAVSSPAVAIAFGTVVDRLAALVDDLGAERPVPVHGDFSPRNVLVTPAGLRLIDLDRMAMAGAGRDVAYWAAWAWVTATLAGDVEQPDAIGRAFVASYLRHRPEAGPELARTLPFHTAAALLRIAHGWTVLATSPADQATVVAAADAALS